MNSIALMRHSFLSGQPAALSFGLFVLLSIPVDALDKVRIESRIDEAVAAFGVDGEGVIVAIIDRGIDWKNNDFRNEDGTTRLKYIFDFGDNSGANAPNNPYGIGTIFTEAQINAALLNGPDLPHRDAVGHGSTTTGIAAGNGRNSTGGKYRGVAPRASIIAVKVVGGAPAHGNQPAEAAIPNQLPNVLTGMQFVIAKAAELGMPVVMLPNLGSNGGPTDGTGSFTRTIDSRVGSGIPGIIFVNGPGDEGGGPNRAQTTVAPGQVASLVVEKGQPGNLRVDLWYPTSGPGEAGLEFTIKTPSGGTYGPYAPVAAENLRDSRSAAGIFSYTHNGRDVDFFNSTSQKREMLIDFTGATGTYTIEIKRPEGAASSKEFIATLNFSNYSQNPQNAFKTFNVPGNVWDGATGFNNISPTDYVLQTTWTDLNGVFRTEPAAIGALGDIWSGSSTGPTFDGRFGVDVAAPGEFLMTVYAPNSYWASFNFNKVQDGNGLYGKANAVSAAAPIVTGIIALMLQANPGLDQIQIRDILRSTARADAFTGAVPNNTWGYGKVDACAAVRQALLRRASSLDVVIERAGPNPAITFPTLRGITHRIEYKHELDDAEWLPLVSGIAGTGTSTTHTDTTLGINQTRFYRIGAE